jgi:uncharacterized protein (UPF0216 family)
MHGQLLIEHVAVEKALVAVQDTFSQVRLAHGLKHLVQKQGLELLRHLIQRALRIPASPGLEFGQAGEIRVDAG